MNGMLYGTTGQGYGSECNGFGCGTVFEISTTGKEQVLYHFHPGAGGFYPRNTLLALNGSLYGMTVQGGTTSVGCGNALRYGCGTVFEVTP